MDSVEKNMLKMVNEWFDAGGDVQMLCPPYKDWRDITQLELNSLRFIKDCQFRQFLKCGDYEDGTIRLSLAHVKALKFTW